MTNASGKENLGNHSDMASKDSNQLSFESFEFGTGDGPGSGEAKLLPGARASTYQILEAIETLVGAMSVGRVELTFDSVCTETRKPTTRTFSEPPCFITLHSVDAEQETELLRAHAWLDHQYGD